MPGKRAEREDEGPTEGQPAPKQADRGFRVLWDVAKRPGSETRAPALYGLAKLVASGQMHLGQHRLVCPIVKSTLEQAINVSDAAVAHTEETKAAVAYLHTLAVESPDTLRGLRDAALDPVVLRFALRGAASVQRAGDAAQAELWRVVAALLANSDGLANRELQHMLVAEGLAPQAGPAANAAASHILAKLLEFGLPSGAQAEEARSMLGRSFVTFVCQDVAPLAVDAVLIKQVDTLRSVMGFKAGADGRLHGQQRTLAKLKGMFDAQADPEEAAIPASRPAAVTVEAEPTSREEAEAEAAKVAATLTATTAAAQDKEHKAAVIKQCETVMAAMKSAETLVYEAMNTALNLAAEERTLRHCGNLLVITLEGMQFCVEMADPTTNANLTGMALAIRLGALHKMSVDVSAKVKPIVQLMKARQADVSKDVLLKLNADCCATVADSFNAARLAPEYVDGLPLCAALGLAAFGKMGNAIEQVSIDLATLHKQTLRATLDLKTVVMQVDPSHACNTSFSIQSAMVVCAHHALCAPLDRLLAQLRDKQGQGEALSQEEASVLLLLGPTAAEQDTDVRGEAYYKCLASASLEEQQQVQSLLGVNNDFFDEVPQVAQLGFALSAPPHPTMPPAEAAYQRLVHRVLSAQRFRAIETVLGKIAMVIGRGIGIKAADGRNMLDALVTAVAGTILPMFNRGWQLCLSGCLLDPAAQAAADQCNIAAYSCEDAVRTYLHTCEMRGGLLPAAIAARRLQEEEEEAAQLREIREQLVGLAAAAVSDIKLDDAPEAVDPGISALRAGTDDDAILRAKDLWEAASGPAGPSALSGLLNAVGQRGA